jgi:hypothetical protein
MLKNAIKQPLFSTECIKHEGFYVILSHIQRNDEIKLEIVFYDQFGISILISFGRFGHILVILGGFGSF